MLQARTTSFWFISIFVVLVNFGFNSNWFFHICWSFNCFGYIRYRLFDYESVLTYFMIFVVFVFAGERGCRRVLRNFWLVLEGDDWLNTFRSLVYHRYTAYIKFWWVLGCVLWYLCRKLMNLVGFERDFTREIDGESVYSGRCYDGVPGSICNRNVLRNHVNWVFLGRQPPLETGNYPETDWCSTQIQ